jgi:hypothetical protein
VKQLQKAQKVESSCGEVAGIGAGNWKADSNRSGDRGGHERMRKGQQLLALQYLVYLFICAFDVCGFDIDAFDDIASDLTCPKNNQNYNDDEHVVFCQIHRDTPLRRPRYHM